MQIAAGVMHHAQRWLPDKSQVSEHGWLMAAIVLSGLMAVSVYGNATCFGVVRVDNLSWGLLLPGLLVSVFCGLVGGLFVRLLLVSIKGQSMDRFSQWRQRRPVTFAAACGLAGFWAVVTQTPLTKKRSPEGLRTRLLF